MFTVTTAQRGRREAELKATIRHELERARSAIESLLAPVSDEQLVQQISPLQSPLVWDLAHIGWFEKLWLLRRVGRRRKRGFEGEPHGSPSLWDEAGEGLAAVAA